MGPCRKTRKSRSRTPCQLVCWARPTWNCRSWATAEPRFPTKWGNTLSLEDRVKLVRHAYDSGIRYFDTAISYTYDDSQAIIGKALKDVRDNVFITTKVDFWDISKADGRITEVNKEEVARQIEKNLAELQSDYIDAILIHGTPGVEQMTVEQCMEVHGELIKARDKGLVRFVGFSGTTTSTRHWP